jgi:hypothetical protein
LDRVNDVFRGPSATGGGALDDLERQLSAPGGDFSDSDAILARTVAGLRLCLESLARAEADLSDLVETLRADRRVLDSVVLHPLVRMEISRQLAARAGHADDVRADSLVTKVSGVTRAVPAPIASDAQWSPALIDPVAPNDVDRSLAATIQAFYANERDKRVRVTAGGREGDAAVAGAAALLDELVPSMWRSTCQHTRAVAFLEDAPFASVSFYGLPGVTMLSNALFEDRLGLAQALLHEGLHHKFHDLWGHWSIVPEGFNQQISPRHVYPPWRPDLERSGEGWPVDTVLGAAHVYVHMIVFAGRRGPDTLTDNDRPYASVAERAEYLVGVLSREDVAEILRPKGRQLAHWLGACFDRWQHLAGAIGVR